MTGYKLAVFSDPPEESCVRLAGFCASISNESFSPVTVNTSGCQDAVISETHLTLAFPDRIESWDLQSKDKTPSWSMEMAQSQNSGILLSEFVQLRKICIK